MIFCKHHLTLDKIDFSSINIAISDKPKSAKAADADDAADAADAPVAVVEKKKRFAIDGFGLAAFGIAVVLGILLGSVKIPLTSAGFGGSCFSLLRSLLS